MTLFVQFIIDGILLGGLYALMAIGFSLSYGVTRIINFAHGEFIMLGAYAAFWMFHLWGFDPLAAMPLAIALVVVVGVLTFELSIARVLKAPQINQILLTFGVGLVLENLAVILWSGDERSTTPAYASSAFNLGSVYVPYNRLFGGIVAVVLIGGLMAWLKWSARGRAVRAVAQNSDAAALMGIDVKAAYALSFAISCALGAATGVVMSFIVTVTPFMGFPMLVKAVAIVILGGMGSVGGMTLGAFILALAESACSYFVPEGAGWSEGVAFMLIFTILLVRPSGLFGYASH
ncbi:branched-chain amino acid ABC transporter permease [Paraburkholderia sp. MM6662-R1]|uniref:branched-chain amino acid ABC transporter permease n=1 Tax=Paraburkholderia sp. MM6662-R1 TaxID=2991066 RepID=UPI003D243B42